MIKLMKKVVVWYEKRYPEILQVAKEDYDATAKAVTDMKSACQRLETSITALEKKLSQVDKLATDTKNELDVANAIAASLLKPRILPDVYGPR